MIEEEQNSFISGDISKGDAKHPTSSRMIGELLFLSNVKIMIIQKNTYF